MASRRAGSFATYANSSVPVNEHESANDFMRLSQVISNNVQKMNQNVSKMGNLLSLYGTPSDSVENHEKLHEIQHYTNQLAKDTNKYIKDMSQLPLPTSEQRQQKLQRERLVNEFTKALTSFQEAQRQEKVKERTCTVKATSQQRHDRLSNVDPFAESSPANYRADLPAGGQEQMSVQVDASDVELEILREREEAVRKLEADISDVNQIFRDLGMLVHEQAEVVDSIESNVVTAAVSVEQGTEQLRKAHQHQMSARKKKCIIIIIVLVIIAIIVIILAATLAPKN